MFPGPTLTPPHLTSGRQADPGQDACHSHESSHITQPCPAVTDSHSKIILHHPNVLKNFPGTLKMNFLRLPSETQLLACRSPKRHLTSVVYTDRKPEPNDTMQCVFLKKKKSQRKITEVTDTRPKEFGFLTTIANDSH